MNLQAHDLLQPQVVTVTFPCLAKLPGPGSEEGLDGLSSLKDWDLTHKGQVPLLTEDTEEEFLPLKASSCHPGLHIHNVINGTASPGIHGTHTPAKLCKLCLN